MKSGDALLRVECGNPDAIELAALAAVLYALQAAGEGAGEASSASGPRWWRRPDAYASPHSWR